MNMKTVVFWDVTSRSLAVTNISEEPSAPVFKVKEDGGKVLPKHC
jgi:hypothetical protein